MKKILVLPVFMVIPMMVLTFLSVALGQKLDWMPHDFGTEESCRLPCWNGIRPGLTQIKDADSILVRLGYHREGPEDRGRLATTYSYKSSSPAIICQVGLGRTQLLNRVSEMMLSFCEGAFLGHMIDMLGDPETILPIVSMVNYQQGAVVAILRSPMCEKAVSPHSQLLFIDITPQITANLGNTVLQAEASNPGQDISTNLPWRGFVPFWRYAQFFPGRAVC